MRTQFNKSQSFVSCFGVDFQLFPRNYANWNFVSSTVKSLCSQPGGWREGGRKHILWSLPSANIWLGRICLKVSKLKFTGKKLWAYGPIPLSVHHCSLPRLVDKEKFSPSESSQTPLSHLVVLHLPLHSLFLLKFSIDSIIAPKGQAANPFPIFAQKYLRSSHCR